VGETLRGREVSRDPDVGLVREVKSGKQWIWVQVDSCDDEAGLLLGRLAIVRPP
jgi:hypothetical protein